VIAGLLQERVPDSADELSPFTNPENEPVNVGFDCPNGRVALSAITLRFAGVMVSLPGIKVIAYFGELKPEQVIGYVPTELAEFAVVVQPSVPVRDAGVSPLAKPLYVTLFSGGLAWPYCRVALLAVIVSDPSAAAVTLIVAEADAPL
jgi:hypothetical protein